MRSEEHKKPGLDPHVALFAVTAAAFFSSLLFADAPDSGLPEVRRVLLRAEQVPSQLEQVRRGVLRQMSRAEFDDLLAKAPEAVADRGDPPALLETRYRASLVGESLVGSATWKVLHRRPATGVLTLDPFSLALRSAAWDDGTPAVLGTPGSRQPAAAVRCLVGRPGEQSLKLDWSSRGLALPEGVRFDLRLPPCPVAVLDLDLPADREPVVPRGAGVLSSPMDATPERRTWRLAFADVLQIDLVVRRASGTRPPPLLLVKQRTRQDIAPGGTECEFSFDVQAPHGGLRELTIACDPALRPIEVSARGLDGWEFRPAAETGGTNHIAVHLAETLTSGTVTLRAIASSPPGGRWTSSAATVVGGVSQGETLAVRVQPDLTAEDWKPGPFRLVEKTTATDRWQEASFRAGLIRTGAGRPECRLHLAGTEYKVDESLWWSADLERMTLTARLTFTVTHGPTFQVPLTVPPGWDVERVEADPSEALGPARAEARDSVLTIELQRPFTSTAPGRLTLHLSRRPARPDERIPFPDVVPLTAADRTGWLAVKLGAGLEPETPVALREPVGGADRGPAPWGDAPPDFVQPLGAKPIANALRPSRRPAHFRARAATSATVVGSQATADCRVRLDPDNGGLDVVILRLRGGGDPADWRVAEGPNRVRSVRRLPDPTVGLSTVLAAGNPWQLLARLGPPVAGAERWCQVTFMRPLTEPTDLEARMEIDRPRDGRWLLPLVDVPAAKGDRNDMTIDFRSSPGWDALASGLKEVPAADGSPWRRTFRYDAGPASLGLIARSGGPTPRIVDARLITFATQADRLVHRLTFRLIDWQRSRIPIVLPANARVGPARIEGTTARANAEQVDDGVRVELPALTDGRSQTVEVVYTTARAGGLLSPLTTEPPQLPAESDGLQHVWCLPAGVEPVGRWRLVPGAEAGPADPSLPGDLAAGLCWESPADDGTVRVARRSDVQLIGAGLAIAALIAVRAVRSWPIRRQRVGLLLWLMLSVVGMLWLPSPVPILAGWSLLAAAIAAAWTMAPFSRRMAIRPRSSVRSLTATGLLIVLALPPAIDIGLRAGPPTPALVYLVPKPDDVSVVESVLVPAELFERLGSEVRRDATGADGALWLEGRYEGRVAAGQARFTAVLRLHAFADDPPPVVLPLAGVQVRDATLDGAPAFLRAAGDHYLVPVRGRGAHVLQLSFDVPVVPFPPTAGDGRPAGPDREVQFTIPEAPITHLILTPPASAKHLRNLTGRGEQHVEADADRPRLEADLGRVGAVRMRWQNEPANPRPATVRIKETYLWDLTEAAARLRGAIRYEIGPGTISTVSVGLPNGLEVVGVNARPLDAPAADSATGWLRCWRVEPPVRAGGRRSLVLDFAGPIGRSWQVNLELVPREPVGPAFTLAFPAPAGIRSAPPVFGWRAVGLELTDVPPQVAIPLAAEAFLHDDWLPAKLEPDPRPPTKAYQRTGIGPAPALRLRAAP